MVRSVATTPALCRVTPQTMSLFPNLSDLLRNSLRQPNLLRWAQNIRQLRSTLFHLQVGKSSLGQRIVGLRISDNVQEERELLKPMVEVKIQKRKQTNLSCCFPGALLRQHARQRAGGSGDARPPRLLPAACQASRDQGGRPACQH